MEFFSSNVRRGDCTSSVWETGQQSEEEELEEGVMVHVLCVCVAGEATPPPCVLIPVSTLIMKPTQRLPANKCVTPSPSKRIHTHNHLATHTGRDFQPACLRMHTVPEERWPEERNRRRREDLFFIYIHSLFYFFAGVYGSGTLREGVWTDGRLQTRFLD